MPSFVPVPDDAIEVCENGTEMGLVLDLYGRARRLRWQTLHFTERTLLAKHKGLGNRRMWSLLDRLAVLGLCELNRGDRHNQSTVRLFCPVSEVQHDGQQHGQHQTTGMNGTSKRPAARVAAQGAALQLESRGRLLEDPSPYPSRGEGNGAVGGGDAGEATPTDLWCDWWYRLMTAVPEPVSLGDLESWLSKDERATLLAQVEAEPTSWPTTMTERVWQSFRDMAPKHMPRRQRHAAEGYLLARARVEGA